MESKGVLLITVLGWINPSKSNFSYLSSDYHLITYFYVLPVTGDQDRCYARGLSA